MTYKINPEVGKIDSPIIIRWNGKWGNSESNLYDGEKSQEWEFRNGKEASEAVFSRHFNILKYHVLENTVIITVYEFIELPKK